MNESINNTMSDDLIKTNDHESIILNIHNENIDVDLALVDLIKKINHKKLITRGSCEDFTFKNDPGISYVLFEYKSFMELFNKNEIFKQFFNDEKRCIISEPYYAFNDLRHIQINKQILNDYLLELNNKTNIENEIWISVSFFKSDIEYLESIC
jgi:hypothetical protein